MGGAELSGSMAGPAALFRIKGRRVRLSMTKGTLCWQYETAQCLGLASGPGPLRCGAQAVTSKVFACACLQNM